MSVIYGYIGIPLLLLVMGILLKVKPPAEINSFYGFRTKRSTSSKENWRLAQQLCGKALVIIAFFSVVAFAVVVFSGLYARLSEDSRALFLLIPVVLLLGSIFWVNGKLPKS